ncbi:hypothetical protein [Okeania sp.]|uniref:hypothetical protein n=1 Tax=Okeania sp. TaxID=3100323 RepID=UPI002B4AF696|nr:hypothetical protein [Okeania sp.]MEB3341598.1 hypothetical protein [Okeania sp.]
MKTTAKVTLFFSLYILGSTLSSCQVMAGYLVEKVADCALFNQCPQRRQNTYRQSQRETVTKQNTYRQSPAETLPRRETQKQSSSSEQALRNYYQTLNNYNYQSAWNY